MKRTSGDRNSIDNRLEFSKQIRANESPFGAIGNVSIGGTVFLGPDIWSVGGAYTIDRQVQFHGRNSTIIQQPEDSSVSTAFMIITADDVVIDGIKFQSNSTANTAIWIQADRVRITNCTFDGFGIAVRVGKLRSLRVNSCTISGNTFSNQTTASISVKEATGCLIQSNMVTDNPTNGIKMDNAEKCLVVGNVLPNGSIVYTASPNNQPDTTAKAESANVANSVTVT